MSYHYPRKSPHILRVKRSNAGLGLFTANDIARGKFVVEYHGPILNEDKANEKGGRYLFALSRKLTIDGTARKNIARYMNHSCRPNCTPKIDGRRIFFYAHRKIKASEELTYNYGREYFDGFIKPEGCRCGHH